MKKSLVIVAAALVLASACQKEQLVPEGNFSIKATREACVDTKATVSDAGAFAWVPNDAIGVYNGTRFSELTTTGSGASATFTGTVVGTPQTCAIFPSSVAKSTTSVTLPDSYVWKNGDAPTPMYAEYNASGLAFKHLGGLVKISLSGVLAGAREFVITADKDITGDYSFVEEGGYKVIKTAGNASNKSVIFTFDAPASDMVFYVPVPVGTYKFAVSLNDAGGNELWKYSGSTSNEVTRAKLIVMPTLTIVALPGSGEGSLTSVTVPENYNGTVFLPATSSTVVVKMNDTVGPVSLVYSGSSHPANVVIDAAGKTVSDLRIVLPDSHVQVLNGTYANITAQTSLSTLVLEKEVKITDTATIKEGSATIASNNVGTVKVESSVQDEAKIVLAPTANVNTINTASSAPIVIQEEGGNQGKVGTVNATQSTAIEFQNEATDPGNIITTGDVSKVNTSTSGSTPGEEETTVKADSQSALAYAFKKGYDVELSADIACTATTYVKDRVSLTLNLNSHKLTAPEKVLWVMNAKLDIVGPGTISETENDRYGALLVSGSGTDDVADYTVVNVGEGVTLAGWSGIFIAKDEAETYNNYGLVVNCNGAKLQSPADGHSTPGHALYINGSNKNTTGNIPRINLKNTSIGSTGTGIYAAGYANWNIEGGSITGNNTAIEIRAGKMTIDGGTYTSNKDPFDVEPNGSGTTTAGAALGISQHTTNLPLEVTVNGGTFNGAYAIWEKDVQDDVARDKIKLTVNDGTFNGAIYSQNNPNCIVKGTYSDPSALAYLADGAQVNIKLGANYTGPGFGLFSNGNGNNAVLDIDLGGHTWTLSDEPLFGSTGTVSQYFHLEKGTADGTAVNFKNGSIVVPETIAGKMLIQNYCKLTLDGVTLTGNANCSYIVSNNNGFCNINKSTINAAVGKCAFDVYSYSSYDGAEVNVTNSTINGKVEFGGDNGKSNIFLKVISGTLNGNLVVEEAYKTCASKNISIAKSGITYGDGVTGWREYVK